MVSEEYRRRVRSLLESMGGTADAVADWLRARGIKGDPGENCSCPVSNALRGEFPDAQYVGTVGEFVRVCPDEREDWREGRVDCPEAVGEFVHGFDNGKYPDLIRGA